MEEIEFGTEKFTNKNCWLVTALGRQIYHRCRYCRLTWRQCYYGPRFLVPSLLIPFIFFLIILIAGIKIERNLLGLLVITYLSIFGIYSYLFNKSADEVVEAGFKIAESETEIGKLKVALEKKLEETNAELYQKNKELEKAVAELKRAEKELRESEEMYKMLVEASPDAVTTTDLEGRITYVSSLTLELHGCKSVEEMLGRSAFEFIAPEDQEKSKTNLLKTLTEGFVRNAEYTFLRKDGTRFFVELNAALIKDAYGKPKAFIATIRDITDRKRAEEKLKKRTEELERMNKFMVGRELDMIELKKEANRLLSELGRPEKYRA